MRHWVVKAALPLFLLAIAACTGENTTKNGFNADNAMGYVKKQLDFGPRIPGTDGAKRTGDWIIREMQSRADTVIVQEWTHQLGGGGSIPMRNIFARFRPELTERILYIAHWDTRPISENAEDEQQRGLAVPGANDGGSAVGMLIALADVLKKKKPPVGVDILFVDGEDYGEFGPPMQDVLIGSSYFAQNMPDGYSPMFGVLWDMIADKELQINQEVVSLQRAPEVVQRVWNTAKDLGYADVFIPQPKYQVTDDHVPLLDAGLRVIDVIDIDYPSPGVPTYHHTPQDTFDKISVESMKKVGNVATELIYQQ